MPAKLDYLRDLHVNPHSTSAAVLARVQAPTLGAVETAFRKYADAKLVESDDNKPKRYTLTDKGAEELRKLESEAPHTTALPESDLIAALAKRAKQEGCRISLSLEPESHDEALSSGSEPDAPEPDTPSVPWDNPQVQQFYGLQLGMSDLPRRVIRGRRDSLAAIVGSETADLIAQLVSCEEQLVDEYESFWGNRDERERLQKEIGELRRKLGCSEKDAEAMQRKEIEHDTDEW